MQLRPRRSNHAFKVRWQGCQRHVARGEAGNPRTLSSPRRTVIRDGTPSPLRRRSTAIAARTERRADRSSVVLPAVPGGCRARRPSRGELGEGRPDRLRPRSAFVAPAGLLGRPAVPALRHGAGGAVSEPAAVPELEHPHPWRSTAHTRSWRCGRAATRAHMCRPVRANARPWRSSGASFCTATVSTDRQSALTR